MVCCYRVLVVNTAKIPFTLCYVTSNQLINTWLLCCINLKSLRIPVSSLYFFLTPEVHYNSLRKYWWQFVNLLAFMDWSSETHDWGFFKIKIRLLLYLFILFIASIAKYELNSNMCVRRWINTFCTYDQYQPEMDSKFRHRMDNRSEVQEIAF
jgi:hypothetical protein